MKSWRGSKENLHLQGIVCAASKGLENPVKTSPRSRSSPWREERWGMRQRSKNIVSGAKWQLHDHR